MSLVYWDSMLFIFWLEDHPAWGPRVERVFQAMQRRGDRLCTGALAVGEVLAGPVRAGDTGAADRVRAFFRRPEVSVLPFTMRAADHFAWLRSLGAGAADAVHLATAAEAGADLFLTHDRRLRRLIVPRIQFIAGLEDAPL